MTSSRRIPVVLFLALVGVVCAAPASASAVELDCGATITEDTTLTADVVCAEGETTPGGGQGFALFIGADGVTLDLNGHKVGSTWSEGISVAGRHRVIVRNGSTPEIHLHGSSDSEIIDARVWWIHLTDADRNRVARSHGGIDLYNDSDQNTIEGNTAEGEGGGVSLSQGSDFNEVRDNTICGGMEEPLTIRDSNYNRIVSNFVPACSGYSDTSMRVSGTSIGNRLIANTVLGQPGPFDPPEPGTPPGDGIRVESPTTVVSGNTTNDHHGYGINAIEGVESGVNYAEGNGNPAQCRNVVCVSRSAGPPGSAGSPGASGPAGPPGAATPPAAADLTPPVASLTTRKRQRLGRGIRVAVSAADEDLWITGKGKVSIAGARKSHRLKAIARRFVAQGDRVTLELSLPAAARRAARRALDRGMRVRAFLTIRVADAAGNGSASRRTVSLGL